jgi:hypothetical protein
VLRGMSSYQGSQKAPLSAECRSAYASSSLETVQKVTVNER